MQPNSDRSQAVTTDKPDSLSAQMEAEINAAMAEMDKETRAAEAPAPKGARPGPGGAAKPHIRGPRVVQAGREHRTGTVVSVGPTDIFLEFGPKELGVVARQGWPEDQLPVVGKELEVVVDRFEPGESLFLCSRPGSVQKADWELLEAGQVIDARVTGVNKGGLELEVAGHRAFMPASQVSLERVNDLNVFVGEKMTCQVTRVDRMGKGNIVLSRRDILEVQRREQAAKLKESLQEGQTLEGIVRKIMPFGVFVDLGGVDGLVHVTDLTHDRVAFGERAIAKYVKEGEKVRVQVLKLDWENNRISLGMKQIAADPFAMAVNTISEGSDVTGRVVRIAEFGAFVEIAPGVDGLVHISEIDHRRIGKVEDSLKVDEIIQAKILKIDKETRRVSLSIKALKPLPEIKFGEGSPETGAPARGRSAGPGGPGGGGGGGVSAGAGGGGGGGGGMGGRGRGGGRGRERDMPGRSAEEILKETPALRRMREKAHQMKFKGGLG